MTRLTFVDNLLLNNVSSSSTIQVGDSHHIELRANALAVQKEEASYYGFEGNLEPYEFYSQKLQLPVNQFPVQVSIQNPVPIIKVGRIRVIATAASSLIHLGTAETLETEARIKHFRSYNDVPEGYQLRPELTIHTR